MRSGKRLSDRIMSLVIYFLLSLFGLAMLFPLLYVISISLSDPTQVPFVTFYPKGFSITNYRFIFSMPTVLRGYINSAIYTALFVVTSITLTTLCAYPLSKKWLAGRSGITVYIIFTMFFSGGLIPWYLVVNNLKMINTVSSLILPGAMNTFLLVITRTFFQNIPTELDESGYIDGASEWTIFTKIYLPLSKPIIATLVVWYAVGKWNSWFDAAIFLQNKQLYPIQLILRNMMVTNTVGMLDRTDMAMALGALHMQSINMYSLNYALTVAVILPILFLYPFLQKYFIKGVMVGSLKG